MKIKKCFKIPFAAAVMIFLLTSASFAVVNDEGHGLHLRGALGGGKVYWAYLNEGGNSGDLGEGSGAGALYLSAMYNYSFLGIEASYMKGNIDDLEWTDKDDTTGIEYNYKSTGSGSYSTLDVKLGFKLFTEPGDMGYTYIYGGWHFWNTVRNQDTREFSIYKETINKKYKADGDGWMAGFRDFSTIGWDKGFAIAIQSGLFVGQAPVNEFKDDGEKVTYDVKQSFAVGAELAAGIALQNLGFSVVGGFRGQVDVSVFDGSAVAGEDESIFGFGNLMFFVEAGIMF